MEAEAQALWAAAEIAKAAAATAAAEAAATAAMAAREREAAREEVREVARRRQAARAVAKAVAKTEVARKAAAARQRWLAPGGAVIFTRPCLFCMHNQFIRNNIGAHENDFTAERQVVAAVDAENRSRAAPRAAGRSTGAVRSFSCRPLFF